MPRPAATAILLALCLVARAAEVRLHRTDEALILSNAATRVVARLDGARSTGFDLLDPRSGRALARITIGGHGQWTASGRGGAITFTDAETSSEVRVELRGADAYPFVSFRLRSAGGDGAPPEFLSCQVPSARVFYRGGFHTPLPAADPFPMRDGRAPAVTLAACPVPAVGLWDPEGGVFAGYEFQEARSSDKSSKHIVLTCRAERGAARFALMAPPGAREVASRFRLIYSTALPSTASPNELVLRHIWRTYRDRLPAAPLAIDVGWLPRRDRFVPDDGTSSELLRRVRKDALDDEAALFVDGTLLPRGGHRRILNLLQGNDAARQRRLQDQWAVLRGQARKRRMARGDAIFWRFPVAGDYVGWIGGRPAATTHSPATWRIGAALLAMYRSRPDPALLGYIDGIFRWTRHCAFTRAGDPAKPAAASAAPAAAGALEFLLNYHHALKDHDDPDHRALAAEALPLARAILYRSLAVYTDDPDEADALDPTFLIQADSDAASFGTVSWAGTGALLRAMALCYVETGDPLLGHLLRGALQRWHLGFEADGLRTIDTLSVLGGKGTRAGLSPLGDALAEYIQPVGAASARVLCGQKQAIAFFVGQSASVERYRYRDGSFSFRLVTACAAPIEIDVTSPLRDLRGKPVRVNGRPADADVAGRHGEHIVIRGVRSGDVVSVGDVSRHTPAAPAPESAGGRRHEARGGFTLVQLPTADGPALSRSWDDGGSWAGLVNGIHHAWGVPLRVLPGGPAAGKVAAHTRSPGAGPLAALQRERAARRVASRRPVAVTVGRACGSLFLFATPSKAPPKVTVTYADGQVEAHELVHHVPALRPGPLRGWRIDMYPLTPKRRGVAIERINLSGDVLLFGVTAHQGTAAADAVLARLAAGREARLARARARRERERARARVIPETRAQVAAATKGKILRIAFLPPHESYTQVLIKACTTLGVPPAVLSEHNLIDPDEFNARRYPIAVYSAPERFVHTVREPGDGAKALTRYLGEGGCLVSAALGYPFYYPMKLAGERLELVKGLPRAAMATELEIAIEGARVPPLADIPRFELVPGQTLFAHLPPTFRYRPAIGGPYRPVHGAALPKEDVFTPILVLKDHAGKAHGTVVATIEHRCPRYKGGRVVFLWGNVLELESGPTIALDLMSHVIRTARLEAAPRREPRVAILPRDMGNHDQAILQACAALGLKTHRLTPEELVDPAVFHPRHFPIAIHAAGDESFLDRCAGRSEVWRCYVNYVRSGGLLVACGNMWQFYYAGTLGPKGEWRKVVDPQRTVLSELGLRGGFGFARDPGPMALRCLPGQDVVRFDPPIPLSYLHWGRYRAVAAGEMPGTEFTPLAQVTDRRGNPFGGYAIARMRYTAPEFNGGEVLWLWGDLLDNPRAHSLLGQVLRYARSRREAMFGSGP